MSFVDYWFNDLTSFFSNFFDIALNWLNTERNIYNIFSIIIAFTMFSLVVKLTKRLFNI